MDLRTSVLVTMYRSPEGLESTQCSPLNSEISGNRILSKVQMVWEYSCGSPSFPVMWLFSCRVSGRQQQAQEGAHSLHQGADPRTGVRVRSPQLPDPSETLRNRCQPRPDRTPGTAKATWSTVVFWRVQQEYRWTFSLFPSILHTLKLMKSRSSQRKISSVRA